MDAIFKTLSDKNRRKILELLKEKDMTAGEIGDHFSISGASLSHHLDMLKRANLLISQRKGQYILYSLNTSVFEEVLKIIISYFEKSK